jgi:hypothetical protein
MVAEVFADKLAAGWDIRPTIAVTKAHVNMPEIMDAMAAGRLKPDNDILSGSGDVKVTKAAIEPVWWLPGIAERFGVKEVDLRRTLFEQTGGMYTELVTRPDLELFLPPIGGSTIYFFGDVAKLGKPRRRSPAASTTSATAPTCSAPTSAPAGPISRTASRSASRWRRRAVSGW